MPVLSEKIGFYKLIKLAFPLFFICLFYSITVFILEEKFGDRLYTISSQIGSVFGLAVAFFLGFRMNSAYDRWWEARKNIGELTYNSRNFSGKVCAYFGNKENLNPEFKFQNEMLSVKLLELLSLYIIQFRNQMHNIPSADLKNDSLDKGFAFISNVKNPANHILQVIGQNIDLSMKKEHAMEKYDLMVLLNKFYEIQGKSERTKNTPFLNIYKSFTRLIVVLYVIALPFFIGDIDLGGESSYLEFIAIPIVTLVGTIFLTINKLANLYGEPFSLHPTSFPIVSITDNILIEIKDVIDYLKFQNNKNKTIES